MPAGLALADRISGTSETFDLYLRLIDDPAGDTVFASEPDPSTAVAAGATPQPAVPLLLYTGTGSISVGVRFVQAPASAWTASAVFPPWRRHPRSAELERHAAAVGYGIPTGVMRITLPAVRNRRFD